MSEVKESEVKITEEIEAFRSKKTQFTLQLAGGAIFGALSTVVAIILSPIINSSRIQGWGIAMFDPTSWLWIACFLIFGATAGLISCVTGSFGLLIIDPTGIGPAFKFAATIPLIIVPYFVFNLNEKGVSNSQKLKDPKIYTVSGLLSLIVRIGAMIFLNLLFFATVWGIEAFDFVDLDVIGLGNIKGITAVLIFTPIINFYTGVLDLVIPYFLVYGSNLDEKFGFW
ncbi:MAG: hypothetical protein ACFFA6_00510 [Promethearchaeota archaeon]